VHRNDDEELLPLGVLATLIGVHIRTLRNAARDGRLPVAYDTRTTFRRLRTQATPAPVVCAKDHQFVGPLDRDGSHHNSVEEGKDRRVDPDFERQRQHRYRRKGPMSGERPRRVSQVRSQRFDQSDGVHVVGRLLLDLKVAELAASGASPSRIPDSTSSSTRSAM